jgi:hypothetical protein
LGTFLYAVLLVRVPGIRSIIFLLTMRPKTLLI